jgi:hypothetical protein
MEESGQFHTPAALLAGEGPAGSYWIGGRVGARAGRDAGGEDKNTCPCRELNPGRPAP